MLRRRGRIALFWNFGDPPERVLEPLLAALAETLDALGDFETEHRTELVVAGALG